MRYLFTIIITVPLFIVLLGIANGEENNIIPSSGYVPDAETAIKIAIAVLEPIYGKEKIKKEAPFKATLMENGIWYVSGSLKEPQKIIDEHGEILIMQQVGGVSMIKISKKTGQILMLSHGM